MDAPGTDLQYCWKYQFKDDSYFWALGEETPQVDGLPRFERTTRIDFYMISGLGFKEEYSLISGQTILLGSEILAAGLALAACATAMMTF